jgi:poly(3-hydroxybutyrate) depolymerase
MLTLFLALFGACQQPLTVQFSGSGLEVHQVLAIEPVGTQGRVAFPVDPIQFRVVEGTWKAPVEGESETAASGEKRSWKLADAGKNGSFEGPAFEGGYAYCRINSPAARKVMLNITGDSMAYLNGSPLAGDPYSYGWVSLPVELKAGDNDLLIATGRGDLKVSLAPVKSPLALNIGDVTLPDAVIGVKTHCDFGGIVVVNSSNKAAKGLTLQASLPGAGHRDSSVPEIPPMSCLKVRFDLPREDWKQGGEQPLEISLWRGSDVVDKETTKFRIRTATQTRKETYISSVDDSVQYYAVVPPPNPKPGLAMMLSLHGAGVEAIGQADAYSPKDWAYVVCPTNRRPFGFDWEDWGREDGLDVLAIAEREYHTDPNRTYVTGHSMGGHGTWQFGALFPDKWAAIGVSAGWQSFYSYIGQPRPAKPSAMEYIFLRAAATSNTSDLKYNYLSEGVYVLHGDADDTVPVTEARGMKAMLNGIGEEIGYHEQPGAGHWWSTDRTKGASCLEWPELMDYLRDHTIKPPAKVDFTTVDLAVNPSFRGIRILRQDHPLEPSRIKISFAGGVGPMLDVETTNIGAFYLPKDWNGKDVLVDGQRVHSDSGYYAKVIGERASHDYSPKKPDKWAASRPIPISQIGPFKEAFNNHAVLVYGTHGTPEENRWAFEKARFDSECFWYRGNGALMMVADSEYAKHPNDFGNAILYGNSDTNSAWDTALGRAPIKVGEGWATLGDHNQVKGGSWSAIFCWRKPGDKRLNAAICGTGLTGCRLTNRIPIFLSGVGFPDWLIITPEAYKGGPHLSEAAGFFGPDGGLDSGDFAINPPSTTIKESD